MFFWKNKFMFIIITLIFSVIAGFKYYNDNQVKLIEKNSQLQASIDVLKTVNENNLKKLEILNKVNQLNADAVKNLKSNQRSYDEKISKVKSTIEEQSFIIKNKQITQEQQALEVSMIVFEKIHQL